MVLFSCRKSNCNVWLSDSGGDHDDHDDHGDSGDDHDDDHNDNSLIEPADVQTDWLRTFWILILASFTENSRKRCKVLNFEPRFEENSRKNVKICQIRDLVPGSFFLKENNKTLEQFPNYSHSCLYLFDKQIAAKTVEVEVEDIAAAVLNIYRSVEDIAAVLKI